MQKVYRRHPRDEAVELIECYIAENGLEPHDRLPPEREICAGWGLSRAALRGAMHKLAAEGKLYSKAGSGTYVAPAKPAFHLREMESACDIARRAGKKLETRVLFTGMTLSGREVAEKLRTAPDRKVFLLQLLHLFDDVPAWVEATYIDYERCPGIEAHDFSQESFRKVMESEYGIRAKHGAGNLRVAHAAAQEAGLLDVPPGTAVFLLSGVGSHGGKPVEYSRSVIRADQIEFVSVSAR